MSGKQPNSNPGGAEWKTPQAISSNWIAGMMGEKPKKPNYEHPIEKVFNMYRKDNPSSSVRVGRGLCMKRAASGLLVLAICLLFVSSVVAASTLPRDPQPSGAIDASKIGSPNTPGTALGGYASDCATTSYAGPKADYWHVPQGDTSRFAMRFTPVSQDTLKTVSIYVWDPGDGSWGNDTIKIAIYGDDGFGLPGTVLATKKVPPGSYVKYPAKTTVSFASDNLVFNSDFHVGVETIVTVNYESILSDSGQTGTGRSSYYHQGQWEPISPGSGPDYNFLIEVYCCASHVLFLGDITGYKYKDVYRNGVHDPTEPGLGGWEINLHMGTSSSYPLWPGSPRITDPTGAYTFSGVPYGTYYICEKQQTGWVQTAPTSGGSIINVAGPITYAPDFMNAMNDTCPPPLQSEIRTFIKGDKDKFVGPPDPSSPSSDLLAVMAKCYSGALPWFDATANNQGFGHTFANLWSSDCLVMHAQLCMRLKATGDVTRTDALSLGNWSDQGTGWGIYLNNLVNLSTAAVKDASWDQGDTMTVCIDLAALPTPCWGSTNIMLLLQQGHLDVHLQDDTEIDYLELTVELCCDSTAIRGTKFNDLNCNGILDGTESGLGGFHFELRAVGNAQLLQTATSAASTGAFSFKGMASGTYHVTEVQQTGWSQTAPVTCKSPIVTVVMNQDVTTPPFGNIDTTCEVRYDTTLLGGVDDNFSTANGAEPVSASPALVQFLTTPGNCSGGQLASFDQADVDRCFGQSFVGNWCNPPCCVIGARLYGRVKALSSSTPGNDGMNFGNWQAGAASVWGIALNSVVNLLTTTGTPKDGSWDYGDVMSFDLDLANLPPNGYNVTSVMPLFHSGGFDVWIQDDTEIDYLRLVLTICCENPYVFGDANHDGGIDISDAVYLIAYIFSGGSAPSPLLAGDANCDGMDDISDVVYLIAYIFSGGSAPCSGSYGKLSPDGEFLQDSRSSNSATLKLAESETTTASSKTNAVEMHTDVEVAGIQLEFKTDVSKVDEIVAQTTERSKNLQLFSGVVDGLFKVGLVDMTGKNAIAAGDGPIASFDFKGDRKNLDLVNGVVCDRTGKRLNVKIEQTGKASALPKQYSLSQNYPNPFNPSTEIRFALPKSCEVRVEVLNVLGETVRTLASGLQTAGTHFVTWDGTDERGNSVSSGVYFYRIVSDEFTTSRKMVLLK